MTPIIELQELIELFCSENNLIPPPRGHYVKVDHALAREICLAYEALPAFAEDWHTRECYIKLMGEVATQFLFLQEHGYTFEPWQQDGQPYQNSAEMQADVRDNHHLYFFTGGEHHPYLDVFSAPVNGVQCTMNDLFRAVHDMFGHAAEGYQFGQRGEENAWIHHMHMFSPLARLAMTSETRGQNSWVNESDVNRGKPACDRAYAQQKAALLPERFTCLPDDL